MLPPQKMVHMGSSLLIVGTTDMNREFHPLIFSLIDT
jgi:hypothetical protein